MLGLRPYKKCDAQHIVSWIKDEKAFRKWSADRYDKYPITAQDINDQYAAAEYSDSFFPMTAYDESGVVGHMIMRFTDEAKQDLRFGFIIVDDSKRGKGYGSGMLRLAVKYAFEILGVKRISLGVFENNPSAHRCYNAVGFRDAAPEKNEYYHILGEDWKCLELEMENNQQPR